MILSVSLFSNEAEIFFNESKENFILCRVAYDTYVMFSSKDASIMSINKIKYLHHKKKDYYVPLTSCKPVKDTPSFILF